MITQVKKYLLALQQNICKELEDIDGEGIFAKDKWQRDNKTGHGLTRVLADGAVFERAGVNFSYVTGDSLPESATQGRPELAGRSFIAMGVSLVVHPKNPYVPTSHANVRFFVANKPGEDPVWWFGGGLDLTPYYGFDEDAIFWHTTAKNACDPFGDKIYDKYKKWCDEYFYLEHRDEQRGIGGLFFDELNADVLEDFLQDPDPKHGVARIVQKCVDCITGKPPEGFYACFEFMKSVGNSYIEAYKPIVEKRKDTEFGEAQKQFQLYRRGRYVEFNLLYDRGTLFGLQTGGRVESILMSLPPLVRWEYEYTPAEDEAQLTQYFLKPKAWINQDDTSA